MNRYPGISKRDALALATMQRLAGIHTRRCDLVKNKTARQCFEDGDFKLIGYQKVNDIQRPLGMCKYCRDIVPLDLFDDE